MNLNPCPVAKLMSMITGRATFGGLEFSRSFAMFVTIQSKWFRCLGQIVIDGGLKWNIFLYWGQKDAAKVSGIKLRTEDC